MKAPENRLNKDPTPYVGEPQDRIQAIHNACQTHIYAARAKTLRKCKQATNKALADIQQIHRQYLEHVALLQAHDNIRIEQISRKYHGLEIANEALYNHIQELEDQAQSLLIYYRSFNGVKQDRNPSNTGKDIVGQNTIEAQQALIEQYCQALGKTSFRKA